MGSRFLSLTPDSMCSFMCWGLLCEKMQLYETLREGSQVQAGIPKMRRQCRCGANRVLTVYLRYLAELF